MNFKWFSNLLITCLVFRASCRKLKNKFKIRLGLVNTVSNKIILVIIYNDYNKIFKNYDCNYLLFISILFHFFFI